MTTVFFPEGSSRPAPVGSIDNGRIDADNLYTSDDEFVAEAEALPDAYAVGRLCQETFVLGVAVRKHARSSGEMISLRDQVKRFEERVEAATEDAIIAVSQEVNRVTDADGGMLSLAVHREIANISAAVEAAFDENDKTSALSRIEESMSRLSQEMVVQAAGAVRQLLNPGHDNSPLGLLRAEIVQEVSGPLERLANTIDDMEEVLMVREGVEAEAQKGTAKGRAFEELVGGALAEVVRPAGDELHATGDTTGSMPGSKAGDYVVVIKSASGAKTRVAVECKDSKLSLKKIREELDRATDNREADVGVMVLSSEQMAPYQSPLVRVAERRYAVVFDKSSQDDLALQVSYQMARTDALHALSATDADGLDLDFLAQKVAEAKSLLDQVTQVKKGIGTAKSGLEKAENAIVSMKRNLEDCLSEIALQLMT